ncbi:MAG: OB-fold protein [Bacteroidales bacterium]
MRKWSIILGALALVGIAAAALYFLVYNKPHPDFEKAQPQWVVSAEALFLSFVEDETAAHNRYTGQVIAIEGELAEVEQLDDLVVISFVFSEGFFGGEGVRCTMLEAHKEKALTLVPGQRVSLKGLCTGFTGTDVILEHCSFH